MTSSAQGKRSDTLGKPPHPITSRPARAKVNITRCFSTFAPTGRKLHNTLYPGRRFACRWAMNFCPFGMCPSDRMPSPVMWHTTSSYFPPAKNPCRSFAPAAHRTPSSRQRSKSKQSVKRPIRAHRCNYLPLVGGASPSLVFFDKSSPHGICVECDLWENIPVPHAPYQIPHPTFHIPHSTFHIPHLTFHIPHSTFSTLLPQIYTFLPVAPRPVSKYAILGAFSQPPNFQPFIVRRSRATFQTLHSPRRNAIFRPSIPALSRLYPLPFAPRYLSPRNPIHAQRPRHPPLTAFPPVPISPPNPPKPRLPALCFTQNPDPTFPPNIFNIVWFSSYRLLGVERGMIYQVDSWIDGLGMMQKCYERSTFAVVAQSAAVE